jgi:ABC-type uncharacterized transport system permease subunit
MSDRLWLVLATLGYLGSAGWSAYALGAGRTIAARWNDVILILAFVCHSLFLYERGETIRHCPVTNLFEVLAFFSWSLVLTYLVIGPAYRMSVLGVFTAPLVLVLNFFALVLPIDHPTSMPKMSWQLEMHAALTLLGFGTLGVAALAGLMYLIQERQLKRRDLTGWFYRLPAMGQLELVHRQVLLWAFALFSIGMAFGFFIPHDDVSDWVKIIWSGGVWLLYAMLLLAPRFIRLSHKKIAQFSVAGYVFVLLTFWGINSLSVSHRFDVGTGWFPREQARWVS